jgi:hypothetical protein
MHDSIDQGYLPDFPLFFSPVQLQDLSELSQTRQTLEIRIRSLGIDKFRFKRQPWLRL